MTADQLSNELEECRRLACTCRGECREKPEVFYAIGCTIIHCQCVKLCVPDWSPREAMRVWNKAWLINGNFDQKLMDRQYNRWYRERFNTSKGTIA